MFNVKAFKKEKFEPRTESVSVPDLAPYFAENTEPVWVVRGLSGHELGRINEVAESNKKIEAISDALVSNQSSEIKDAIKALIGLDGSTPVDIVRRIEMLAIGSVEPEMDHEAAVKLCTYFPVEFMMLTQAITKLTGQGATVKKKPQPSGAVQP